MRVLRLRDPTSGCGWDWRPLQSACLLPQKSHPRKEAAAALLMSGGPETSTWRGVTAFREDGAAAPPPLVGVRRGLGAVTRALGARGLWRHHHRARQAGWGRPRSGRGRLCPPLPGRGSPPARTRRPRDGGSTCPRRGAPGSRLPPATAALATDCTSSLPSADTPATAPFQSFCACLSAEKTGPICPADGSRHPSAL